MSTLVLSVLSFCPWAVSAVPSAQPERLEFKINEGCGTGNRRPASNLPLCLKVNNLANKLPAPVHRVRLSQRQNQNVSRFLIERRRTFIFRFFRKTNTTKRMRPSGDSEFISRRNLYGEGFSPDDFAWLWDSTRNHLRTKILCARKTRTSW